jgi:SAM-dependent methyltransferase
MDIFENYASYYNLLYQDKDYVGEAKFVHKILQTYVPNACQVLELGCGTGVHAALLAEQGYYVHGVDFSEKMLEWAKNHTAQLTPDIANKLMFTYGDIRKIRLNNKFDAVLALFHVISYQTGNEDLAAAFATAKEHLKAGGVFIFDAWYGPAVLNNLPTIRVKRSQDEKNVITRIAEPIMHPNENLVDVNYQVFIEDQQAMSIREFKETHQMRYLFKSEIESLSQQFDLKLIYTGEWMSDRSPGLDTWGVYFVVVN